MPGPILLIGSLEPHAATVISNLLKEWEVRTLDCRTLAEVRIPSEQGHAGLVVLQSPSEKEGIIVGWCRQVKANPDLAGAKLLVALDPDLASQYAAVKAVGADECLMVPASSGHVEKLLQKLLG